MTAGRDRFLADGYAGARVESIAKAAQISTATVYSYFPHKADLFEAVIGESVEAVSAQLDQLSEPPGAPFDRLTSLTSSFVSLWGRAETQSLLRLVAAEATRFPQLAIRFRRQVQGKMAASLAVTLASLVGTGALVVGDPALAAQQLLGMVEHGVLFNTLLGAEVSTSGASVALICAEAVETFLARYGV